MRTLEDIRKTNRREDSLFNRPVTPVVQLTPEEFAAGRKEYEEFVKPISQRVFVRQLVKGNL